MNPLETHPQAPSNMPRLMLLGVLGLLLFALGQFQESVFALLMRLWQQMLHLSGQAAGGTMAPNGLSKHGLPVGITYRLLYCGLSVLILHVLLRGRRTWWIAGGYGVALTVGMVLLLVGKLAGWPLALSKGYYVLGLVCSPLPLLVGYMLKTLPGRS